MCVYVARAEEREREARTDSTTRAAAGLNKTGSRAVCASAGIQITVLASRFSAKW